MSHSKEGPDESLLVAAPATNRLFIVMAATALIAFLGVLAVFSYTVINHRALNRDICETANTNRVILKQLIIASVEEQIIPGEIRSAENPKQPGQKIIFYVPKNPNEERTKESLALVKPIDCDQI